MKWIDLRSDTVTMPTDEMRKAMANALVGDDVYEDDPTVNKLEELAAKVVGKEAALFVPSGTFGNQVCIFSHTLRGDEILIGDPSHILIDEVGALSVIAGVQSRTYDVSNGRIDPEEVRGKIRAEDDIHFPRTGLVCMEDALADGRVLKQEDIKAVYEVAKEYGLPVHVDGARIFNAATSLGIDVKEITQYCDSVMFCLSKGLCAPVGSMVAGTKEFITTARKGRKLMGGGLRQAGILAAAGIIALENMTGRLKEDHDNANYMAKELSKIDGIDVLMDNLDIDMVYFDMKKTGHDGYELEPEFYKKGIKINPEEGGLIRFVTNHDVNKEDIDYMVKTFKDILAAWDCKPVI